jgi:glycosyltransferase involved in cell wall biosynthesis
MKILAVYPYVPYPLDRGAYHRAFHLLKGLSREHDIDLIALAENGAGGEHASVFAEFCRRVRIVPFQHPQWQKLIPDRLRNGLPSTVEHWNIPALDSAIGEALAEEEYDAAHVFDIVMARPFLQKFRSVPLVADRTRVDLQYQLMERRRMNFSFKKQLLSFENMAKIWRYERAIARHAALQIVCGPDDLTFLRKHVTRAQPIEVLPNGVDLEFFKPNAAFGSKEPQATILFCGAMDYNPNVDGLRWHFAEMHQQIADAMPGLQTWIVGKDPVPEVKAYGQLPNVTVTGGVPDVRPYYQKAWLQIVPIRIGGGTRLKIVESLAMGTPVVSTTIGAQGLGLEHGKDALLADSEFDFIEETLRGLRDTELRQKLAGEGQSTVAARLSWEGLGARLRGIYAERFGRNQPRKQHLQQRRPALA